MMYAKLDNRLQLARPDQRAQCSGCGGDVVARCGDIRIWHWTHVGDDCDPWSEPESEWHLGWKKHAPTDRTEVMFERGDVKHRADVVCANGAVLELQASAISPAEIREREGHYKYMAWLFRVTWTDRLQYGKKGFWWKGGAIAQTHATSKIFWHFEADGLVQEVKLGLADDGRRVLGRAVKTYEQKRFAEFIATGKLAA
jgi:hypothetical protein